MAIKNITPTKIPLNEEGAPISGLTMVSQNDTAAIDYSGCDAKIIVCIKNTGASPQNVVFAKGNGLQGVADMTVVLKASETRLLSLESGKFKNTTGDDKGKVIFTSPGGIVEATAYLLP